MGGKVGGCDVDVISVSLRILSMQIRFYSSSTPTVFESKRVAFPLGLNYKSHLDFTSITLRFHFKSHLDFTSLSPRFHFGFTLNLLRFNFEVVASSHLDNSDLISN